MFIAVRGYPASRVSFDLPRQIGTWKIEGDSARRVVRGQIDTERRADQTKMALTFTLKTIETTVYIKEKLLNA